MILKDAIIRAHQGDIDLAQTWAAKALKDTGFDSVDYVAIRDAETLAPVTTLARPARILAAAKIGKTRAIENMPLRDVLEQTQCGQFAPQGSGRSLAPLVRARSGGASLVFQIAPALEGATGPRDHRHQRLVIDQAAMGHPIAAKGGKPQRLARRDWPLMT